MWRNVPAAWPIIWCVLSALLIFTGSGRAAEFSPVAPDRTSQAEQFVDTLAQGDFDTAVKSFDATMTDALPAPKLKAVWNQLERQAGKYRRQLGHRTSRQGGYDIIFVSCQFERAVLDAKVVFNAHEQIAGLFFTPGKAPDADAAARDRPPKSIRESEVAIGAHEWALPGTLTMPVENSGGPHAAVVLVHGSGPNDRDESVGANKPFRDLAWCLGAKGIAVLRYDKRTKVHPGKLRSVHPFTVKDEVLDDAAAAVQLLRATNGINPDRIFVLGHSLGGTLAPRIGQADAAIAGLIIMAGATRQLEDAMAEQTEYLLALDGNLSADDEAKLTQLREQAAKVKKLQPSDAASRTPILGAPPAYWLDLRTYDPPAAAAQLKMPLLILQGGRDYQVTPQEFEQWKGALAQKANATLKLFPKLNHLFIAGEGKPTPAEYDQPGHVADEVINEIATWIEAQ